MNVIEIIKKPIIKELHSFEKQFVDELKTENPLLTNINEYIQQRKGKQLRPILMFLSAKICGTINEQTIISAISIELLHTASLIHDDVIDIAFERRGRPSVNARWNNKIAILAGDYLLSKSLNCAIKANNLEILHVIAKIGMELTDGELLQLENMQKIKITEDDYYKIIRKKTALLFSSCCIIGGLSVNANQTLLKKLKNFGEYVGICFQIKDDIFDYSDSKNIGKPRRNDIREGKITLPLIYALQQADEKKKEKIINWIKKNKFSEKNIEKITNFVYKNGGIEYATSKLIEFKNKALTELDSFEESEIKQSLKYFAEYMVTREE